MEIAIDLGKQMSYVVMEDNGVVVKEGYVETTKDGFSTFFGNICNPKIIVEASSTTNWIANMFEGYNLTIANPSKVRLIAQSVKKTDKIDAHILMDLYKKDYLPKSYLPKKEVRDARDLSRDRALMVKQRVAIINQVKYRAFCIGINIKGQGIRKKILKKLKKEQMIEPLVDQLNYVDTTIRTYNKKIEELVETDTSTVCHYARLIDTIPGFGPHSAFMIAAEIGDINRFRNEFALFSYAGVVPRVYQSGDKNYRGHITKGNKFLKTILLQCANAHLRYDKDSVITYWWDENRSRIGKKKVKIGAMKRLLRIIYWMLMRDEKYHDQ